MFKKILLTFTLLILVNNFENNISAHELNYDPVEYCMKRIMDRSVTNHKANYVKELKRTAQLCKKANASTKTCMERLIDAADRHRGYSSQSHATSAASSCVPE